MPKLALGNNLTKGGVQEPEHTNIYSLTFDGTDDYLEVPLSYDIYNGGTIKPITVAFWIKKAAWENASDTGRIFSDDGYQTAFSIREYGTSGQWRLLAMYGGVGSSEHSIILKTGSSSINSWIHVAMTLGSTADESSEYTSKIYLNGALVPSGDTASGDNTEQVTVTEYATLHYLRIGKDRNQNNYWQGRISDAAVWDATLDADDISKIYNSGKPLNLKRASSYNTSRTSNLLGWWRFGDGALDGLPVIGDEVDATLGSELLDETSNFTDGNWDDGAQIAFSSNNIDFTRSDDGDGTYTTQNLTENSAFTVVAGSVYVVTVTVSAYTTGRFLAKVGNGNDAKPSTSDGTFISTIWAGGVGTYTFKIQAANTTEFTLFVHSSEGFHGSISNMSVKKINGNPGYMLNMTESDIERDAP